MTSRTRPRTSTGWSRKAAEVPITRICDRLGLILFSGAILLPLAPAAASVDDLAEITAYARARAADSLGASGEAAKGYAAALTFSPDNEVLAARTLTQAIEAGDRALALTSARMLERSGMVAPDVHLLLLGEAVRTKNWKAASGHAEAIGQDDVFAFMAPALQAWIAVERGGKPLEILDGASASPLAASYAAEQRPLILLAMGKGAEGTAALLQAADSNSIRAYRLRIAGAALLARKGDRARALQLLEGDAEPILAARRLVEARKPVPGEIAGARAGIAEFLVRVALDLQRQDADTLALVHARLASFMAPENSETWLTIADLLAQSDQHKAALAAIANVRPGDPFAGGVTDARVRSLLGSGDKQLALEEADAAVKAEGATATDWIRLGEAYAELQRFEDSARAYEEAIRLARPESIAQPLWALWLLQGSAFDQADKWPEARAALQEAYKLAPEQPLVLNYLGYAQLERRENLAEAEKLIEQASRLQPDDAAITDSLGWTHYIRGNLTKAIELLETAVAGQPADPAINEHLGDAYYSAGRRYEARYAWEAALLHAQEDDAAKRLRAKIDAGLKPELASP